MCLDIINYEFKPINDIFVGFKIFKRYNKKIYGEYFSLEGNKFIQTWNELPLNTWLKATKKRVYSWEKIQGYDTGFHIFMDESILEKQYIQKHYSILPILYRKPRIIGKQYGENIIIADEMYIPFLPK